VTYPAVEKTRSSVTQSAGNVQYDVYFRMTDATPFQSSIQCPLDSTSNCFWTSDNSPATLPADGSYRLLPGVLVAYKVPASDIPDFVPAVPQAKK